jgi:hypothetical protein
LEDGRERNEAKYAMIGKRERERARERTEQIAIKLYIGTGK